MAIGEEHIKNICHTKNINIVQPIIVIIKIYPIWNHKVCFILLIQKHTGKYEDNIC